MTEKEAWIIVEEEKISKVTNRVNAADYSGPIYDYLDNLVYNSIEDYKCKYDAGILPIVYACKSVKANMPDLADFLKIVDELNDNGVEFPSDYCLGVKDLERAIDAFTKANENLYFYEPDFDKVVIL